MVDRTLFTVYLPHVCVRACRNITRSITSRSGISTLVVLLVVFIFGMTVDTLPRRSEDSLSVSCGIVRGGNVVVVVCAGVVVVVGVVICEGAVIIACAVCAVGMCDIGVGWMGDVAVVVMVVVFGVAGVVRITCCVDTMGVVGVDVVAVVVFDDVVVCCRCRC